MLQKEGSDEGRKSSSKTDSLVWSGTWVGCENCGVASDAVCPKASAFASSDMTFNCSIALDKGDNSSTEEKYTKINLIKSEWDLAGDNDRIDRYQDTTHTALIDGVDILDRIKNEDKSAPAIKVVATGTNGFGDFISAGYFSPEAQELTIARRYLGEKDPRSNWGLEEVWEKMQKDGDATTSWKTDAMNVDYQNAKRRKTNKGRSK